MPTYNVGWVCIILLNPFGFKIRVPLTAPTQLRSKRRKRTVAVAVFVACISHYSQGWTKEKGSVRSNQSNQTKWGRSE